MATSVDAVTVVDMKKFSNRVNFFVCKIAVAVMIEVNTEPNHTERVVFANKVFVSDFSLNQYVNTVLTNATLLTNLNPSDDDNGINDADMEFTVNSFYNAFSGVST